MRCQILQFVLYLFFRKRCTESISLQQEKKLDLMRSDFLSYTHFLLCLPTMSTLTTRIIAQPKPCTYPTPTRESTSCCPSRCSTATALTSVSSSARGSKSSPSPPKRSSPSKTLTVSLCSSAPYTHLLSVIFVFRW